MNILSIQSSVAYGHAGNASAVFPLQRVGAEVWTVNTVQFSNHTGYGHWTGSVFSAAHVVEIIDGIEARGVLPQCDAVLSGYMGGADIAEAIVDTVRRVKRANPEALYCCDPVLGDVGRGIYVRPGIPELMRDVALPVADIATPNQFELEWLTGRASSTLADAKDAVAALQQRGPRTVLITSLRTDDMPADAVDLLAAHDGAFCRLRTPLLPISVNGAGDAIAALFLFHWLRTQDPAASLEAAGSSIHGLLRRTAEAGAREILTVAAQDEFVSPSQKFTAVPC